MAYRMIVLDLDDTLLREDLTISERTKASLMRAQSQGVKVVLASGRPTGAIWRYARELELAAHGGWIISFNGAVVTDCATGQAIFEQALARELIHEIHDLACEHDAGILSYVNDQIVTPQANPWTEVERTLTGMDVVEVPDFKKVISADAIKVIVVDEPERLKATADRLRPRIDGRMNMVISKPFFLEFTSLGIDKKHSLSHLADRLSVRSDEVMAVGDSYNDLGMLQWAGLGVCMANGPQSVRDAADHVTASNMEDGVARAVEQFVFGEAASV
ncbi:MAG: HAD family phosphatase [Fibrobacterota bacterium]|nr:HAD family phosphatase [Fibrobacterota bacterium]QQS05919.1 MAG: HAD family phosphatase [Fibrobacterota bacterium]